MSLGIIAQAEGVFDGLLAMGWAAIMSARLQNTGKAPMANELDYCIIGGLPGECCSGRNEAVQTFSKPFMSNALDHPNISGLKAITSAGLAQGIRDTSLTMIWYTITRD